MVNFISCWYGKLKSAFKTKSSSPNSLAVASAVGTAVGLLPVWGQAYICFLIWLVFKKFERLRFNLVLACAITFISNPITTPFFAYGYYILGSIFIEREPLTFDEFVDSAKDIIDSDSSFTIKLKDSFDFALSDVGLPIAVGCGICILVLTPLAYIFTYKIAEYLKLKKSALKSN